MSKKDRNATKAKRMEEKKKIKLEKKREKLNVLKVFGICLCFFAIILLVGILYITADYRAQKSAVDKYFSAVQNMDYDSLSEVVYPPYIEKFDEYKEDDNFKDFYMNYLYGYLGNNYEEGFKLKYKVKTRYAYSDMLMKFYKISAEGILMDVDITLYDSYKSEKSQTSISLAKYEGKWYVVTSDIEATDIYYEDIANKYKNS